MDITLGQLLEYDFYRRDAVHIAIVPVVAGCQLRPGQGIGFRNNGNTEIVIGVPNPIGIVDPFYKGGFIEEGQRFWMLLLPNTITSLRHEWTHPAFKEETLPVKDTSYAQQRMERFAKYIHSTVEDVLETLAEGVKNGDVYVGDDTTQEKYNEHADDLWDDYEVLTSKHVSNRREIYFSCAC